MLPNSSLCAWQWHIPSFPGCHNLMLAAQASTDVNVLPLNDGSLQIQMQFSDSGLRTLLFHPKFTPRLKPG